MKQVGHHTADVAQRARRLIACCLQYLLHAAVECPPALFELGEHVDSFASAGQLAIDVAVLFVGAGELAGGAWRKLRPCAARSRLTPRTAFPLRLGFCALGSDTKFTACSAALAAASASHGFAPWDMRVAFRAQAIDRPAVRPVERPVDVLRCVDSPIGELAPTRLARLVPTRSAARPRRGRRARPLPWRGRSRRSRSLPVVLPTRAFMAPSCRRKRPSCCSTSARRAVAMRAGFRAAICSRVAEAVPRIRRRSRCFDLTLQFVPLATSRLASVASNVGAAARDSASCVSRPAICFVSGRQSTRPTCVRSFAAGGVFAVAAGLAGLRADAAQPVFDLVDDVGQPQQVLLDAFQPPLGFDLLGLEAADAGGFLEDQPAVARRRLQQRRRPCPAR